MQQIFLGRHVLEGEENFLKSLGDETSFSRTTCFGQNDLDMPSRALTLGDDPC